ncbi:MAG: succinate dehydrogenase assembly factor 2 [Gammaproteobacteria bacterium]|nr:succinate dehydrogenase assembly factor 2 [Gammaproteobacteria bacterium]
MDELIGKLRWRCRRGMKELDLLTLGYLERYYPNAPLEEQQAFAGLLELQDPQLMGYMLGRGTPPDTAAVRVVGIMRTLLSPAPEIGGD